MHLLTFRVRVVLP